MVVILMLLIVFVAVDVDGVVFVVLDVFFVVDGCWRVFVFFVDACYSLSMLMVILLVAVNG